MRANNVQRGIDLRGNSQAVLLEFLYRDRRRVVAPYCGVSRRGADVLRAVQVRGRRFGWIGVWASIVFAVLQLSNALLYEDVTEMLPYLLDPVSASLVRPTLEREACREGVQRSMEPTAGGTTASARRRADVVRHVGYADFSLRVTVAKPPRPESNSHAATGSGTAGADVTSTLSRIAPSPPGVLLAKVRYAVVGALT